MAESRPFEERPSRSDRKAAAARAKRRVEARAAAEAASAPTAPRPAPGPAAAPVPRPARDKAGHKREARASREAGREANSAPRRRPGLRLGLISAVVVLAFMATVGFGGPVLGHGWNLARLALGTLVVAAVSVVAIRESHEASGRARMITGAVSLLLGVVFVAGAATSVVIKGHVYPSTSKTAKAYHLSHKMYDDLQTMARLDTLLSYEQADARAHYDEYDEAIKTFESINVRWALLDLATLPSPQFAEPVLHLKVASRSGAEAMKAKQNLIAEHDARLAATMASYRATFVQHFLQAGPQLGQLSTLYGFSLVPDETGPVE